MADEAIRRRLLANVEQTLDEAPPPPPRRPRLIQVAMDALAQTRASFDLEPLSDVELEQQATVFVHALYGAGWSLRRLLPEPEYGE